MTVLEMEETYKYLWYILLLYQVRGIKAIVYQPKSKTPHTLTSIACGDEIILCQLSQKLALHDGIKRLLFSSQEATLSLETPLVFMFQSVNFSLPHSCNITRNTYTR